MLNVAEIRQLDHIVSSDDQRPACEVANQKVGFWQQKFRRINK